MNLIVPLCTQTRKIPKYILLPNPRNEPCAPELGVACQSFLCHWRQHALQSGRCLRVSRPCPTFENPSHPSSWRASVSELSFLIASDMRGGLLTLLLQSNGWRAFKPPTETDIRGCDLQCPFTPGPIWLPWTKNKEEIQKIIMSSCVSSRLTSTLAQCPLLPGCHPCLLCLASSASNSLTSGRPNNC